MLTSELQAMELLTRTDTMAASKLIKRRQQKQVSFILVARLFLAVSELFVLCGCFVLCVFCEVYSSLCMHK